MSKTTMSICLSIVSITIAVSSVLIPTIISTFYDFTLRRFRFYKEHKAMVIERYVRTTGYALNYRTDEALSEFGMAHGEMLLFVDDDLRSKMNDIFKFIRPYTNDHISKEQAFDLYLEICAELSELSPRVKRKCKS